MNKLAVIIPAQGTNVYHREGDLAPFGDVSLIQWKLTQVDKIDSPKTVYITSSSDEVADFAGKAGVKVIRREADLTLKEMISYSLEQVDEDLVLWTHATSPFIGARIYQACLESFLKMPVENDSLMTVHSINEYILYNSKPINFEPQEHLSRRNITPVQAITNGCFIIARERAVSLQSYIGSNPSLYELDRLSAMEIKDVQDMSIANDLLALYIKQEVINS